MKIKTAALVALAFIAFLGSASAQIYSTLERKDIMKDVEETKDLLISAMKAILLDFANGQCRDARKAKFSEALVAMNGVRKSQVKIINENYRSGAGGNPTATFMIKQATTVINAIDEVTAIVLLGTADFALQSHCYEEADTLYREVIKLQGPQFEVVLRRAQIGIDDVREKRRSR